MLGLCGMIVVQLTLIGLMSYWISWDMQHQDERPLFMKQVGNDFVRLFRRLRGSVPNPGARVASPGVTAKLRRRVPS
jgi:hypothetical protein